MSLRNKTDPSGGKSASNRTGEVKVGEEASEGAWSWTGGEPDGGV